MLLKDLCQRLVNKDDVHVYKTISNYPLLGSHFSSNHIWQAKSNVVVEYPHNTLQIKFNWGLMSLFGLEYDCV